MKPVAFIFTPHSELLFPKDVDEETYAEHPEWYTPLYEKEKFIGPVAWVIYGNLPGTENNIICITQSVDVRDRYVEYGHKVESLYKPSSSKEKPK